MESRKKMGMTIEKIRRERRNIRKNIRRIRMDMEVKSRRLRRRLRKL